MLEKLNSKCCIIGCEKEAELFYGTNNIGNYIPFCKEHMKRFQKHTSARENMFVEREKERILKLVNNIVRGEKTSIDALGEELKAVILGEQEQ